MPSAPDAPFGRIHAWAIGIGWIGLLTLLAVYPLAPGWLTQHQFYPFVIGMVFLGLPHGAMDHLVIPHLRGQRLTIRFLIPFLLGYLLLVAAYLVFWRMAPLTAFAAFLVMSLLHWGQGDGYALSAFEGRAEPRTGASLLLVWIVRGALPILLPILAFPTAFPAVASGMLAWYGPARHLGPLPLIVRHDGLLTLATLVAVYLVTAWHEDGSAKRKAFWVDFGEICLLWTFFSCLAPVLAVGVYFCVWHSWRHICRLMLTDFETRDTIAQGHIGQALLRTTLQSAPLTLAALGMLAGLYFTQSRHSIGLGSFVYLYLSLIAALTFPHFLLVLWMDRRQGLLTPRERSARA